MKQSVASLHAPGRMTVLAALLAGLSAPALASNVVISQVYGGGGNAGATYRHDFIEILNTSGVDVSIASTSIVTPPRPARRARRGGRPTTCRSR